eukprot:scpid27626/ scgid24564/ Dual specificity tyrosine-phosphorylation-regulated kinase 4
MSSSAAPKRRGKHLAQPSKMKGNRRKTLISKVKKLPAITESPSGDKEERTLDAAPKYDIHFIGGDEYRTTRTSLLPSLRGGPAAPGSVNGHDMKQAGTQVQASSKDRKSAGHDSVHLPGINAKQARDRRDKSASSSRGAREVRFNRAGISSEYGKKRIDVTADSINMWLVSQLSHVNQTKPPTPAQAPVATPAPMAKLRKQSMKAAKRGANSFIRQKRKAARKEREREYEEMVELNASKWPWLEFPDSMRVIDWKYVHTGMDMCTWDTAAEGVAEQFHHRMSSSERIRLLRCENDVHYVGVDSANDDFTLLDNSPDTFYCVRPSVMTVAIGQHIMFRYEVLSYLKRTQFAQVLLCYDHKSGMKVALKIGDATERSDTVVQSDYHGACIVAAKDKAKTANFCFVRDGFFFKKCFCIVMDLLGPDLSTVLNRAGYRRIQLEWVKRFARNLVRILLDLADRSLIHGDIRPDHVLMIPTGGFDIKLNNWTQVCDSSVEAPRRNRKPSSYCAPEVLMDIPAVAASDMWSVACIIAEMALGYPLFAGRNKVDMVQSIAEVIGCPATPLDPRYLSRHDRQCYEGKVFFTQDNNPIHSVQMLDSITKTSKTLGRMIRQPNGTKRYHLTQGHPGTRFLRQLFPSDADSGPFVDFLKKCFQWKPGDRITAMQAMQHPWLMSQDIHPPMQQLDLISQISEPFDPYTDGIPFTESSPAARRDGEQWAKSLMARYAEDPVQVVEKRIAELRAGTTQAKAKTLEKPAKRR